MPSPDGRRPTWDETWLTIAQVIGQRSLCSRRQVGAVIVTHDNRVASVSYNGPPRGQNAILPCLQWCQRAIDGPANQSYEDCDSIHAEANALLRADYTDIAGGTIYVSSAVCVNCAKLIANSGVVRVIHVVQEADHHRDPQGVERQLADWGIEVRRVGDLS